MKRAKAIIETAEFIAWVMIVMIVFASLAIWPFVSQPERGPDGEPSITYY